MNDAAISAVAVIGMAFRFPGDVHDEDGMWRMLKSGGHCITSIPDDRWPVDELQHADRSEPGRSVTFAAGILRDVDMFDAAFFGISPREAAWMDPQQRLLLEMSYEAMEHAGVRPSTLAGSRCGVYVGISSLDYGQHALEDLAGMSAYTMTGNTLSVAANRISYVFDLHGPSMAVDTACSSSLVALHQACQAMHRGEVPMALVGGVHLLMHPYSFIGFSHASMLSATGRCRPFDAAADGYVRAEGGAVLLIKPLSAAVRDGDPVRSVILATGVNADGSRKAGLTIPSADAQEELMRSVLERSGLRADDIDFIEAHGTGTPVGDPVEIESVGRVFGRGRKHPVPVGSVKANVGHLEPASGMAGLVKAMLCLRHGELPPMPLRPYVPNPHIDFEGSNVVCAVSGASLQGRDGGVLHAGVNAFGFGGVNAHVVLQSPPSVPRRHPAVSAVPPLLLGARTDGALRALALAYAGHLEAADASYYDVAYGAAFRRDRMERRLAVLPDDGSPAASAAAELRAFAGGSPTARSVTEDAMPDGAGVVFVYSGNGAQWHGMGRTLYEESPCFARTMDELDAASRPLLGFSLTEMLLGDDPALLQDTTISQPLLFAMQVGITKALRELGIVPHAVMGHSVGEIAAAWACGALDLGQALRVIHARSRAQGRTKGMGRMAAMALSRDGADDLIRRMGLTERLEVAGINSPRNVTLSGDPRALERLQAYASERRIFFRLLDLDYAFHSRTMDGVRDMLARDLKDLRPSRDTSALFVSTVTGRPMEGDEFDGGYWWSNVRKAVDFASAVRELASREFGIFVEIGPHAILQRYIRESLGESVKRRVLPSLQRGDDGIARLRRLAARLHLLTDRTDLRRLFPCVGDVVPLPSYAWQRTRFRFPRTGECLPETRRVHPLLGWTLPSTGLLWENILDPVKDVWIADHDVGGAVVYPGAGYVETALAAARAWLGDTPSAVESLDIVLPMVFEARRARCVRCELCPTDGTFRIVSRSRLGDGDWSLHAKGRVIAVAAHTPAADMATLSSGTEVDGDELYRLTDALGLRYGPSFRVVRRIRMQDDRLDADLVPLDGAEHRFVLHPVAVDACFHALAALYARAANADRQAFLPVGTGRIERMAEGAVGRIRARLRRVGRRSMAADFELLDEAGRLVAGASDCRFRAATLARPERTGTDVWNVLPWLEPLPGGCSPSPVPPLETLVGIAGEAPDIDVREREAWFTRILPRMEAMALSSAFHAMRAVAAVDPRGTCDASAPYVRWLTGLLRDEGLSSDPCGAGDPSPADDMPSVGTLWREAVRLAPRCLPALLRVGRVGLRLPDVLSGRTDGVALLEEVGSASVVREGLSADPAFEGIDAAVKAVLRHLARTWPPCRRLRVLEVAVFPGGLTELLDGLLPRDRFEHVLALRDGEALNRARARFGRHASVDVVSFDAERGRFDGDAAPKGTFDLVVLRHVLHRAADLAKALAGIRGLMAPGGLLLVAERHPDWSTDLVEGLDPAWWHPASETSPDRPVSSLLPPEAWQRIIGEHGFGRCLTYAEPASGGLAEGAYLLLAVSPATSASVERETERASWLLLADEASRPFAEALGAWLGGRGQAVAVSCEDDCRPEPDTDHVVFLRGHADAPGAVCPTLDALVRCARTCAAREPSPPRLWIVTVGGALGTRLPDGIGSSPAQCAVGGLGRVIMNEHGGLRCTLLDVPDPRIRPDVAERLERELLEPDGADEVLLTADARYVLRVGEAGRTGGAAVASASSGKRVRLDFSVPGRLGNLAWQADAERAPGDGEVEARVMATGLNFRDVMLTMGLLPDDAVEHGFAGPTLGLEFAGVVTRVGEGVRGLQIGDDVMGFAPSCFASHVITPAHAVTRMPKAWIHAAAATVPTVFFTAWYALRHLARIRPGERLLVHGAAGGVGIAAIQIARHLGAEVFATAGSEEKRDVLRLMGVRHVFDSRGLSFADDIRAATDGQGVDVALNSLAGEAMRRTIGLLRPFGRFLELGKRDFVEDTALGLRPLKENIGYFAIDADQILAFRPDLASELFREVMALLEDGTLTSLPYRVFPADRVEDAFRAMQQSRHVGKIVVVPSVPTSAPERSIDTAPADAYRARLDGDGTWLVTGGLSGFGLATARHLAERGARHLVLVGRRGAAGPGADRVLQSFEARGIDVRAEACDVADADAVRDLVARVGATMPPLRGVVHAAAVFDDRLLANMDAGSLHAVLEPKLSGAWNMHEATKDLPLEHFVMYSSIGTVLGNPGQGNYVAANAGLEGLTRLRLAMGLPAVCIAWGPIGDAGYLARNETVRQGLARRLGRPPLEAARAMRMLDVALKADGQHIFADVDWNVAVGMLPGVPSRFRHAAPDVGRRNDAEQDGDFRHRLAGKSPEEVMDVVRRLVIEEVAQVLGLGAASVPADRSVRSMGLDSLMAMELAVGLEQRVGVRLPVMMLQDSPSVERIAERIAACLSGTARDDRDDDAMLAELARRHAERLDDGEAASIVRDAGRERSLS